MSKELQACACGEYPVCLNIGHPKCDVKEEVTNSPRTPKVFSSSEDFNDDFGFSVVTQDEQKKLEQIDRRLDEMRKAIEVLLFNLSQNPDSELIRWPNRLEKIEAFRKKLDIIQFGDPK